MKRTGATAATSSVDEALQLLFHRALAGDEAAYRAFLEQIAQILRAFLHRTMRAEYRSAEKVEDLVQEVLLTIHRKRDLYRTGMPVLPWVRAIAKHRLIDSIRADSRRLDTVELSEAIEAGFAVDSPAEVGLDLEALLAGLNPQQREVLKLAKVDGLPLAEISSRLGISLSLVKVTVHRSLHALRKSLQEKKE